MVDPKRRIPGYIAWLMIGTALLLDLISIFPVAQWFTDIANAIFFPLWFGMRGASFFKKKNLSMLGWEIIFVAVEAIPVVGEILPGITTSVVRNILFVRKQDKKATAEAKKSAQAEQNGPIIAGRIGPNTRPAQAARPEIKGRVGGSVGNVNRKAA